MANYNLLMIGAGRMAEAIVSGLRNKEETAFNSITVSNKSDQERLSKLKTKYQVHTTSDWKSVVHKSDVIILAAPPSAHEALFSELSNHLDKQLIITVAAGIDPSTMEVHLPEDTPVCWFMPNTAALIGKSMTTFACGKSIEHHHRKIIEHILSSIGEYEELTEQQVHDLTAVTGSAPAFLYLVTEALQETAKEYGLTNEQAKRLVTKMISGSAAMLETGTNADELRAQVTTPGGSTAAGVSVLEEQSLKKIIKDAIIATNEHARKSTKE
ncbi:pyrroline-5-carboxylate reductase [Pseudalkalibacillus sp. SCS-8]|uniref:pyrroline-5-carboxylate reductase n=1 Tax=Pseudalkalibacillus nanhaiensis TaxID=3115291 RepID=UPI0032DAFC8F